jgi:hypothetical protein
MTRTEHQKKIWGDLLAGDLFSPLLSYSPEEIERELWLLERRVHRIYRTFKEWQGRENGNHREGQ